MPASPQDFYKKVGANTVTTLAAPGKNLAATSINVGATTNYPTDTGIVVGIRVVDSNGTIVPGTYTEWNAVVASSTAITIEAVPVYGTDQVYPAGSLTQVFLMVSSSLHNQMVDGLLVSHNQDGTLKGGGVAPTGVVNQFAGSTAPTGWLLCYGQAISRTTYASLFAVIGEDYGAGDGSTTFLLPDLRGRVIAGQDDMGGTSANRLTGLSGGVDGDTLGAAGGSEKHTLSIGEMPSHNHTGATGASLIGGGSGSAANLTIGGGSYVFNSGTSYSGGGGAHNNVQPTIIMNSIIKT